MVKKHNYAGTKDKIISLLLSHKKKELTIRAIAKETSIDYKTVHVTLNLLIKDKIIKTKKAGQSILCSIDSQAFNSDIFRAETLRRDALLKNKNFKVLYGQINERVKEPFFILLLFGSYASGKSRKGSDVDLMLITDKESVRKKVKHLLSLLPLKVHLVDFNSEEFLSMLKTTEFNVGKEARDNNIILVGIESYYRLRQNA